MREPRMVLLTYVLSGCILSANAFRAAPRRSLSVPTRRATKTHNAWASHSETRCRRTPTRLFSSSSSDAAMTCDVLVLGSGPASRSVASLLAAKNLDVIVADQNNQRRFAPNYGVWKDEWQAVIDRYAAAGVDIAGGQVGRAIDREWSKTDCYFGGSFGIPIEQRMRLDRPYQRVDRDALRDSLTTPNYRIVDANHISQAVGLNVFEPASSIVHGPDGTTIVLESSSGERQTVQAKMVVDGTGHETKLTLRDARENYTPPGFQIAYGVLVDVKENDKFPQGQIGPYDKETMALFDYRTDHFDTDSETQQMKAQNAPTFMYAMPLKDNTIFFEETSLVARPALSFQECKDRCFKRLAHLGIEVTNVYEEEFCYIPMGGALPAKDQRITAIGGAAAMVHPSTGYHLCRCMMGAADMCEAIAGELAKPNPNLDRAAGAAYHSLWSPDNIRQRNFAVFGGEFLMKQKVVGLRGFFDGFFRLPLPLWAGFLAGWPGLPNNDRHETWLARLIYGLNFIVLLPPPVALDLLGSIVGFSLDQGLSLPQSVTPFFGQPLSYQFTSYAEIKGDVPAKTEARRMLTESPVEDVIPVAFDPETNENVSEEYMMEESFQ